ncbi:MAG: hypothetical protein JWR75_666 [Devosia sp.]|nr:hypothetical protein [Devosia sp.]
MTVAQPFPWKRRLTVLALHYLLILAPTVPYIVWLAIFQYCPNQSHRSNGPSCIVGGVDIVESVSFGILLSGLYALLLLVWLLPIPIVLLSLRYLKWRRTVWWYLPLIVPLGVLGTAAAGTLLNPSGVVDVVVTCILFVCWAASVGTTMRTLSA